MPEERAAKQKTEHQQKTFKFFIFVFVISLDFLVFMTDQLLGRGKRAAKNNNKHHNTSAKTQHAGGHCGNPSIARGTGGRGARGPDAMGPGGQGLEAFCNKNKTSNS